MTTHLRLLVVCLLASANARALPLALPHAGRLLAADDRPLEDAALALTFRVRTAAAPGAGDTVLWEATCTADVRAGLYAVVLGDGCGGSLDPAGLASGSTRYLEVAIGANALLPRTRVDTPAVASVAVSSPATAALRAALGGGGTEALVEWTRLRAVPSELLGHVPLVGGTGVAVANGVVSLPSGSAAIEALSLGRLAFAGAALAVSGTLAAQSVSASSLESSGAITAASFSGSGAGLTNVPAAQVAGAFPIAQVPDFPASKLTGTITVPTGSTVPATGTPGELFVHQPTRTLLARDATRWNAIATASSPGSKESPGTSCKDILTRSPVKPPDGLFWIDPDGATTTLSPTQVWCDMTTDGGGWTQIAYLTTDAEGMKHGYNDILRNATLGRPGFGSYKIPSSVLVNAASELRYSMPSGAPVQPFLSSWALDMKCGLTAEAKGKINTPGYMNQPPAAITCTNLATGVVSATAKYLNYQEWSGCWTGSRLWIGLSAVSSNQYHGDYCVECIVTWKCDDSTTGVYQVNNAGNGTAAFWVR